VLGLDRARELLIGKWKGNPEQTAKHSPGLNRADNIAEFTLLFSSDDGTSFVARKGVYFENKDSVATNVSKLEKGEGENGYRIGGGNFNFLSEVRIVYKGVVLDRAAD